MKMIDTLAYVRQVTAAGIPRDQAEVMAEALRDAPHDEVARKRDIVALRIQVVIDTTLLVPILGKLLFFHGPEVSDRSARSWRPRIAGPLLITLSTGPSIASVGDHQAGSRSCKEAVRS